MNLQTLDLSGLLAQIVAIVILITHFVLAFIVLGTTMRLTGHPIPYLPVADPTPLAYLCGAFWLFRK